MPIAEQRSSPDRRTSVRELAVLFLTLGTTAFGGPAAHIAMMEDAVVRRRRWLSREEFLDYGRRRARAVITPPHGERRGPRPHHAAPPA